MRHEPSDRKQSPQAKEWYETIFGAFHELTTDQILKDRETGDSNSIRFSREAQEVFVSWITNKENAIREGLYPRLLASHASKYTTLFASLSLIFHLIFFFEGKTEVSEEISVHAANLARKWCDYFFHHARRTLSESKPYPLAVRALALLISNGELKDGSSLSALHERKHLHLRDVKETREALEFLAGKKIVRLVGEGNAELIRINPHASTSQSSL